jgi:hypothetical protein
MLRPSTWVKDRAISVDLKKAKPLVAVSVECFGDVVRKRLTKDGGSAKVSPTLFGDGNGQVASSCLTVLDLALGGDAKTLFGSLVGLHLGHDKHSLL